MVNLIHPQVEWRIDGISFDSIWQVGLKLIKHYDLVK